MSTKVSTEFKFITICELSNQLGIHRSTYRKLKKQGIKPPGGLIGPKWIDLILKIINDENIGLEETKQ